MRGSRRDVHLDHSDDAQSVKGRRVAMCVR